MRGHLNFTKLVPQLDYVPLVSSAICFLGGVISHLIIFEALPKKEIRDVHNLIFGICYDLMNGSGIAMLGILVSVVGIGKCKKTIHGVLVFLYLFFLFIDINYVQQFGTHIPLSAIEYLDELGNFRSTIISVFLDRKLWLVFAFPLFLYLYFTRKISPKKSRNIYWSFARNANTFLVLLLLSGISGAYSNSYVSKNLNNPLTSSAAIYFYWSKDIEKEIKVTEPTIALRYISEILTGEKSKLPKYVDLPLVRTVHKQSCEKKHNNISLAGSVCSHHRPNILFLFLESFRAVDVGVYGSKLKITPFFDQWSKKGIFFENFYANGFQTRHGQVAAYCSIMPNYGAAVMKKYAKNRFYCLPEHLKKIGYQTSWVFGSDAAFDDQIHFLPGIGIDKVYDQYSFEKESEVLGWGISDRELYRKWIEILDREKNPFFSSALTITNHHPFEVPEKYKLNQGQSNMERYYEAMHYTDAMLNDFLTVAEQKPWYRNSLIFIFADTANYQQPQAPYKDFEDFIKTRTQIPMVIVGGLVKYPFVEKRYFSQIDLPPTVLDLLGDEYTSPWVGTSMLDPSEVGLAFTNRPGNYWGVMSIKGRYYNEANIKEHSFGFLDNSLINQYKRLGESWIKVTQWLLQENLYWRE